MILNDRGNELLAQSIENKTSLNLEYFSFKLNGEEVYRSGIGDITRGENEVTLYSLIDGSVGSFNADTLDILTDSEEIVSTYLFGEYGFTKIADNTSRSECDIAIILQVSNAESVSIVIDPNILSASKSELERIKEQFEAVKEQFSDLENQFNVFILGVDEKVDEKLNAFSTEMDAKMKDVDTKIDNVDTKISDFQASLDTELQTKFDDFKASLLEEFPTQEVLDLNFVRKREGYDLSKNDFSDSYKAQVEANTAALEGLDQILGELI